MREHVEAFLNAFATVFGVFLGFGVAAGLLFLAGRTIF